MTDNEWDAITEAQNEVWNQRLDVEVHWTNALTAGGCNGCGARGQVLRIRLKTVEVRVCRKCLAEITTRAR